jgi:hypothetical protein
MNDSNLKCVMVIDAKLPIGIVANTSAILGITLGKQIPEQVGEDVRDVSNKTHLGIITIPVAMLRGNKETLKDLRERLYGPEFSDLVVVDFSDVAQSCNIYNEYLEKAAIVQEQDHTYLGIAIYGNKKKVTKLTGSMPLLS